MPRTPSSLSQLFYLVPETNKETQSAHLELLDRLYKVTEQRTRSANYDESKYYEGWNTILHYFRAQTNYDITIAPQRRFVRNFYDKEEPGMLDTLSPRCKC